MLRLLRGYLHRRRERRRIRALLERELLWLAQAVDQDTVVLDLDRWRRRKGPHRAS